MSITGSLKSHTKLCPLQKKLSINLNDFVDKFFKQCPQIYNSLSTGLTIKYNGQINVAYRQAYKHKLRNLLSGKSFSIFCYIWILKALLLLSVFDFERYSQIERPGWFWNWRIWFATLILIEAKKKTRIQLFQELIKARQLAKNKKQSK